MSGDEPRPFDPAELAALLDGWPDFDLDAPAWSPAELGELLALWPTLDLAPGWTAEELEALLDGNLWPGGNP